MSKKSKPFLAHSELTDCIYIIDGNDKYEVTEQCIKAMKTTNRMPRWIPVSERLPEEAGMYLCSYDDDDVGTSYFDIRMNEFNMLHEQVTAWMYIPEPYQPENPTVAEGSDKE